MPNHVTARVAVEQGMAFGWERYVGRNGGVVGMHTFGASAPMKDLQVRFGFTPRAVIDAALKQIGQQDVSLA